MVKKILSDRMGWRDIAEKKGDDLSVKTIHKRTGNCPYRIYLSADEARKLRTTLNEWYPKKKLKKVV